MTGTRVDRDQGLPRIAVLDDYQEVALKQEAWRDLAGRAAITSFSRRFQGEDEIVRDLAPFDVLVLNRERTPLSAAALERLPNLKLIATSGMRNAAVDLDCAARRGVYVCGTETLGYPTVELTWALILAFVRDLPAELRAFRRGVWQTTVGSCLRGKRLGVLGVGRIGADVSRIGRAFGMDVIGWSKNLTEERAAQAGARLASKDEILAEADVLTLHLPLTKETVGLIGQREISRMKPTCLLVNTARAAIIDERALVDALAARRIGGAALDVFHEEPLPAEHALRGLDNVLLTPHLGYVVQENYALAARQTVDDILGWLAGAPLRVIAGPSASSGGAP